MKATSNSNNPINIAKPTDTTDTPYPNPTFMFPKINIKLMNPRIMIWPAVILAKSRTINTNGL